MARDPNNFATQAQRARGKQRRRSERWCTNRAEQPDHQDVLQLSVVRPVARKALVPGVVVWAHVPFEETDGFKLRPAVVKQVVGRNVTVFPATSAQSRRRYPWDHHELLDPAAAGFRRSTAVRLAVVTLDLIDAVSVSGQLGADDRGILLEVADGGEPLGLRDVAC